MTKNQQKVRRKVLGEALNQSLMARGMPNSEYQWIKRRLAQVRMLERKNPGPDTDDGAELALVKDFETESGLSLLVHPW